MDNKEKNRKKKIKVILGICISVFLFLGGGLLAYIHKVDTDTLGRKITIYGLDVSGQNVEKAGQTIRKAFQDKKVVFREDGSQVYQTTVGELGYSLDEGTLQSALTALKQQRDQTRTFLASWKNYEIEYQVNKDETAEQAALTEDHFGEKERTEAQNAEIRYSKKNKKFVIVKQVAGTQIDEERLRNYVDKTLEAEFQDKLLTGEVKIDLNQQAYKQPSVKASKELKKELKSLNGQLKKYRKATITYTFGNTTETLDSKTVNSWISIQGTKIIIDQEQAGTFISQLANKYNTIYVPRTFHTSMGTDVTVEDNEYGYRIDQSGELSQLLSDLKSGKDVVREPVYSSKGLQRNGTDDLAGSYIEVSLDAQHLWLYKDGGLVTETDIVSGAPTEERHTYTGAWPIAYKASPFTLTSDAYGYDTKVKYWMPFVYGQGLHDAPWQSAFGGNRYKTGNGSHGCINLPEEEAAIIYENIDKTCMEEQTDDSGTAQARLQLMMQFLHQNYAEDISLEEIACYANISKSTVLNLFNRFLHITPINYLIGYRLKKAALLIKNTEKKINTISYETGFHNVDYFCRAFKKSYKMTPTEYRKSKNSTVQ